MKNLRTRFNRFCYKNRDKGIPNLMLYIVIGSAIVFLMSLFDNGAFLFDILRFDKTKILQGQVWRLVTYIFTYMPGSNPFLILIGLYFFYHLGRQVEHSMGTLRFNMYYFMGVLLMDIFALLMCPTEPVVIDYYLFTPEDLSIIVYSNMAFYLHISILLIFAVTNPDIHFLVFFLIPVKAWFLGVIYIFLQVYFVYSLSYPVFLFPHNLFPLVGVANFLLFAGRNIRNLLPPALRTVRSRPKKSPPRTGTIPFSSEKKVPHTPYNHRCTICGRTDVTNPELEFRYCSRCQGYFCYCEDHISNHTHIE